MSAYTKANMYEVLLCNDQLQLEMMAGRFPHDFLEGDIEFAPTYKIFPNSSKYELKRVPGWTDRILYKSKEDILTQWSYDSINTIRTSDH